MKKVLSGLIHFYWIFKLQVFFFNEIYLTIHQNDECYFKVAKSEWKREYMNVPNITKMYYVIEYVAKSIENAWDQNAILSQRVNHTYNISDSNFLGNCSYMNLIYALKVQCYVPGCSKIDSTRDKIKITHQEFKFAVHM